MTNIRWCVKSNEKEKCEKMKNAINSLNLNDVHFTCVQGLKKCFNKKLTLKKYYLMTKTVYDSNTDKTSYYRFYDFMMKEFVIRVLFSLY